MSRAYLVYFMTFAALIGGMALIMTMGDAVRAPDDLSGVWAMEWDNAPPPESGEPVLRIAQSGRFFVVTFGDRPPMSMTLQDGWTGKSKGRKLHMTLERPLWKLHLNGDIPPRQQWQVPELKLELVGPTRHIGIARRVFPETQEQANATSVSPSPGTPVAGRAESSRSARAASTPPPPARNPRSAQSAGRAEETSPPAAAPPAEAPTAAAGDTAPAGAAEAEALDAR